MKEKFEIKELINVGVFTALYFVVVFVTCFIGMIPICMVLIPLIIPIIAGIPLMLFYSKIKRFGMFTISGVLFGLIMFLMGSYSWVILLTCGLAGLLADVILMLGGYKSIKHCIAASAVFSLWGIGTFISLFFGFREEYLQSIVTGYGQEYVDALSSFTPAWMFYVMAVMCVVGGLIGGLLGAAVLKKHFRKAGMA